MRRSHTPVPGWNDENDPTPPPLTPNQVQDQIAEATKEATERVGMSGSLGTVAAGGIRIDTAAGVNAYQGGERKTSIEPDGDFFAGSNVNIPAGTSFMVFAVAQDWNGEAMEEGDILIGDNSDDSSNIKWDASEGQWQFRLGQTINVYMDTDGKVTFGGGNGWMDSYGLFFENQLGQVAFVTTAGDIDLVQMYIDGADNLSFANAVGGKAILFRIDDAAHNVLDIIFNSDDNGSIDIPAGATYNIDGTPHAHTLTGAVTPETNANDIFRVNGSSTSAFVGTIATLPGGADLTYNVTSGNENAMVPASTSQLAKLRLYNSTRGDRALISNCNTGTNTITLAGNVPVSWQVGDTIDIASQTVAGGTGNWVDLEIASGPTGKAAVFMSVQLTDSGAGNITARIHPLETFGAGKIQATVTQVAAVPIASTALVKMTGNVFSASWIASGAGTLTLVMREVGYTA